MVRDGGDSREVMVRPRLDAYTKLESRRSRRAARSYRVDGETLESVNRYYLCPWLDGHGTNYLATLAWSLPAIDR